MKLEKISIRNFRSIESLEITFINNQTIFVGENNVGKSSIIEAIGKALHPESGWDSEEWYLRERDRTIEINLTFALDESQIKEIISLFDITVEEFKEIFTDKLNYKFEKSLDRSFSIFRFGDFNIEKNMGWFGDQFKSYKPIYWKELLKQIRESGGKITLKKIKEILELESKVISDSSDEFGFEGDIRIDFGDDISQKLLNILRRSMVFIEEFRERPQKTLGEFLSSPTGRELTSVLFNLKNSRQKAKFEEIRTIFNKLFPNLDLDVIRENGEIRVLIRKNNVESTTFFIGSGILESIQILTHVIAHGDKVICIDHPELHLHPHTQRLLSDFIRTMKDSQILIVTHSPYFVNLDKNSDVIRVFQDHAQTKVVQLLKGYFQDSDYNKLSQFLDANSKELFFARKVVLVEGSTELGALPVFSSEIYNFDENGITIISVGGKNNFEFFAKLCTGFNLPCLIIADKDAESIIIEKICKNYPTIKFYILPKEFDDILPPQIVEEAKKVVGEKSKPRIGRYIAKRLLELREIPKEIKEIIEEVKSL